MLFGFLPKQMQNMVKLISIAYSSFHGVTVTVATVLRQYCNIESHLICIIVDKDTLLYFLRRRLKSTRKFLKIQEAKSTYGVEEMLNINTLRTDYIERWFL